MTSGTGSFAELLWPGIIDIWGQTYNRYPPLYTQIFEIKKSDKAFEKAQGVTDLPLASIKDQGSPIAFVDPYQGFQREFVNLTYALGASVTREMYEDDQYDYINGLPGMLAESMRQTEETIAFNHLNNGFSATFLGADGVALFSAVHPLVAGGTFSNTPATASDLTMTSLEQAVIDLMSFVDDQSKYIKVTPRILVVPTALWAIGEKVLTSDRVVGSSDNDPNVVRGKMKLLVSPYLTDSDAWFVTTDVPTGFRFYERRAAEIDKDNEFTTQNMAFVTTKRWSSGWINPRCAYGTAGA